MLFYHAGGVPRGAMGRLIDDCGRHLASQAQALDAALGGMQGRLVVVPEGNSPEDEILARVAERRGIASACIQQGWSPIRHPGFCNLNYSEMLVWGDGFADLLAAANPRQRFASTGNFHLAADMPASGTDILFLFQGFDDWLGGRAGAEAMLTLVERTAAALPEISVFVRPHPVAPFCAEVSNRLLRNPNVRIETPADVPLAQALAKVRVSVSAYSTTILESIAAGVVPVIFNTVGLPHYWPDVAAANAGIEVRELEAAQAALVQLLRKQGALEAFREPMAAMASRFFSARGSAARDATVSALRRLAKGP
ncbi:MAG TPA: hypothetical protein VJS47_07915 [Rhizomicrobium sp.]|nr:hypothetical protein [Rhizomicrobium sp.]